METYDVLSVKYPFRLVTDEQKRACAQMDDEQVVALSRGENNSLMTIAARGELSRRIAQQIGQQMAEEHLAEERASHPVE